MHAGGQLPLALRYPPDQRLDTFTDAPAGALAQLRALAESASADWLYLNGPVGVGKTHLALATCAAAEAFGRRAAYVPLGAAKGRLQDALEAMHGNDVVALDGVDLIAGSGADELALFDFHNRARSAGVSLLYAAEVAPDGLAVFGHRPARVEFSEQPFHFRVCERRRAGRAGAALAFGEPRHADFSSRDLP